MDSSLKIPNVCSTNVLSIQQNIYQRFSKVLQKLWKSETIITK